MRRFFFAVAAVMVGGTASAQDDATGFVSLLNQARAVRGLGPVRHDPGAVLVAAQNNLHQMTYGLGHHVVGSYGQVAAVGVWDAKAALDAWTGSPSHAALIYAPDLIAIGFHQANGVATASTQQSFAAPTVQHGWVYQPQWVYIQPGWYPAR